MKLMQEYQISRIWETSLSRLAYFRNQWGRVEFDYMYNASIARFYNHAQKKSENGMCDITIATS